MLFVSPFMWLLGIIIESVAHLVELVAFLAYGAWVGLMSAVVATVEGVNDLLPEYDLVDNAVGRAAVMGGIGVGVGFVLMVLLIMSAGLWYILFGFVSTILVFAFLGAAADPRHNWSLEGLPWFNSRGGPRTPLNL